MNWQEKLPYRGLRQFVAIVPDGLLHVLVGRERFLDGGPAAQTGRFGWHLSISHISRVPTWDEIKEARYMFCPDEVHMAMILPPKAEFVNLHKTTMHLYEIEKE